MNLLIHESFTIGTPDMRQVFNESTGNDKDKRKHKRIIVEIAAIHEGVTKNFNKYTAEELEKAVPTWMSPYPKPIIVNHNIESDALGRMVNSELKRGLDGEAYIQLRAVVVDPVAAAKVIDGRYLTGSVGGVPSAALCSICHTDVVAASRQNERCGHSRGEIYNERVCVYEHKDISFHEYSFVNAPGDTKSLIQGHVMESDSRLHVYSLDFEEAKVSEFMGLEGFVDIRESMSESEAHKTYLDIAFGSKYAEEYASEVNAKNITFAQNISTIAKESDGSDLENNQMTSKIAEDTNVEEEDILAVADRLSTDLSEDSLTIADEKEDVTEVATAEVEEVVEDVVQEVDGAEVTEPKEVVTEEIVDEVLESETEEVVEETEVPSATETEVEESENVTEAPEEVSSEEEAPADTEDEVPVTELQGRIKELELENTKLRDQNQRMKSALHAELAEKVVDARIAVGHIDGEGREKAIAEHKARSASSLADALVDIRSFAEKNNFRVSVIDGTVPGLDIKAIAISETNESIAPIDSDSEVTKEELIDPTDLMVKEFTALLSMGSERFHNSRTHSNK